MTKSELFEVLKDVIANHPDESQLILMDIIVNYFAFSAGKMDPERQEYAERLKNNENKITLIKEVREKTYCGLREAKDYIEEIERDIALEGKMIANLPSIVAQIKKDYYL